VSIGHQCLHLELEDLKPATIENEENRDVFMELRDIAMWIWKPTLVTRRLRLVVKKNFEV